MGQVSIGVDTFQQQIVGVTIVLNDAAGSFVTSNQSTQAVTLLHELSHAIYDLYGPLGKNTLPSEFGITPDNRDPKLSMANTAAIDKHCH